MDNSKTMKIVGYMRTHTGITQMDAYDLCKATRLAAIIHELKDRGLEIKTIYHPMKIGRYAEYQLTPRCKKELAKQEKERKA